jgi:hypothetical protein
VARAVHRRDLRGARCRSRVGPFLEQPSIIPTVVSLQLTPSSRVE